MTNGQTGVPRIKLGHRIDALSNALRNLRADPQTARGAKRLIGAIRSSSELRGMSEVGRAAQAAEEAPPGDLAPRLEALILAMRAEAGRQPAGVMPLLVVSADPDLGDQLETLFAEAERTVVRAQTTQQAIAVLDATPIAAIVVDAVLAGQDGRNLIVALRSRPASAVIPIVAVLPRGAEGVKESLLALGADASFEKPIEPRRIRDFLDVRMKRGDEQVREARRDPLTGLLNRAAFCEAFDAQMSQLPGNWELLALGLMGVAQFGAIEKLGPIARDKVLQDIGSLLSGSFRSTDVVARWGTAEFIVLLPGEDPYGGARAIEKALALVNRLTVETSSGKTVPLVVCAGLTVLVEKTELADAVEKAEQLLFAAYRMPGGKQAPPPIATDAAPELERAERVGLCLKDPTMAKVLKPIMEKNGFAVELLSEPDEVRKKFLDRRYHLLILDDDLPDGRSAGILKAVRALPNYGRLPIVMLVSDEQATAQALDLGATDFAVKPFAIGPFMSRLRRILWQEGNPGETDRPSVLIVDHEIPQLLVAGTSLHQHGCRVFLAYGSRDGLRRLNQVQPDCLILDLHMPDQSGGDFMKAIPKLPALQKMAVVPAADWTKPMSLLPGDIFDVRGRLTRPFKPGTLWEELRNAAAIKMSDAPATSADQASLQSEIARVLSLKP